MTTPTVLDFPQPFGVPMYSDGTGFMKIKPEHQNISGGGAAQRVAIPAGVSYVQATYSGESEARLFVSISGTTRQIGKISARSGGGERSTPPIQLATTTTTDFLYIQQFPAAPAGTTGGITVMPYPLP